MPRENKTQYAILGALSAHAMSGYDIKKWITDVSGSFWSESPGQVYPTLKNLVSNGLIDCDDSQGVGNRPKKMYALTKNGLAALKKWLREPAAPAVLRDEFILKLFYGNHLTSADYLDHLKRQKKFMEEELINHQAIEKHVAECHKNDKGEAYRLITLSCAICHNKAEIEWCEKTIKLFSKKIKQK